MNLIYACNNLKYEQSYKVLYKQCNFNCFTVQCNFDNGTMCLFINAKNDEFDWTLQNGKTASDNTGPLADVSGYGALTNNLQSSLT